jgi:hypothetical protein
LILKRGKFRRALIVLLSALSSTWELTRNLWRSERGKWWLVPLVVFLCVTGLLMIFAGSVEALAPFIYAIF